MQESFYKYQNKNECRFTGRLMTDPMMFEERDRNDTMYQVARFYIANNVMFDKKRRLNKIYCEAIGIQAAKIEAKLAKGYEVMIFGVLDVVESKAKVLIKECYLVSIPKAVLEAEEQEQESD